MPRRTGKRHSTPARQLLEKIRPYSVYPLDFEPWQHETVVNENGEETLITKNVFENSELIRSDISIVRSAIEGVQGSHYYSFLDDGDSNYLLAWRIYRIISCAHLFYLAPTIREFEEGSKVFLRIAKKYPRFISKAASILDVKYSHLHVISEDYVAWAEWLWHSNLRSATPSVWSDFVGCGEEAKSEAIKRANLVLDSIPPDKHLRNGRPKNHGLRKLIEAVYIHWKKSGKDPTEHRVIFYAYLDQLLEKLREGLSPELFSLAASILSLNGENIRDCAQETIERRVAVKKWGEDRNE